MAVLSQTRSFRDLDRPTLEVLVAAADTYRIEAGRALFRENEPFGNVVYVLYDGAMRQYRSTGFECDVHQGDFLALANYVDRTPFGSTVEAVSDCVVLGLAAETLEQLERNYPSLFNCLNRIIAHKLRARSPVRDINRGVLAQPVRSIMNRPVTCGPHTRLRDAMSLIRQRSIGGLVVTGRRQPLAGHSHPRQPRRGGSSARCSFGRRCGAGGVPAGARRGAGCAAVAGAGNAAALRHQIRHRRRAGYADRRGSPERYPAGADRLARGADAARRANEGLAGTRRVEGAPCRRSCRHPRGQSLGRAPRCAS